MGLIRSVPISALVMAAVWFSTVPTYAQGVVETPEIKAFMQHAEKGDCGYLNEFTDKNIMQSGALGIAARTYAIDALTKEAELPPSRRVCRYHDRRTALSVAIRLYEGAAERMVKSPDEVMVTVALEGALGNSWQDKLAHAGVRPAMQDLVSGQVKVSFAGIPNALAHLKSGRLRALAVSTAKRWPDLPEVPTVAEAGVPDFEATLWLNLAVPAATPADIVQRLYGETAKALQEPELQTTFRASGVEAHILAPQELGAFMRAEYDKWGNVVRATGATVN